MIIGLTGGIGSGKSTVSSILASLGAKIIDADSISRHLVKKGKKAYFEIIDSFGNEVVNKYGEIDRKKLGNIVFNDEKKLNLLNQITHKYISQEIIRLKEVFFKQNKNNILVIDVAIPLKHGFLDISDEIWVVFADEEKRIERVMKRSGLTYDEVKARILKQMNYEDYFELADRIIYNNDDKEKLTMEIKRLYSKVV